MNHRIPRRSLLAGSLGLAGAIRVQRAAGQPAPPPAVALDGDGSLAAMLGRAPRFRRGGANPVPQIATYADIDRQFETRGLLPLDAATSEGRILGWREGMSGLWADDLIATFGLTPELWEAVGFGPADMAQSMTLGVPPVTVRLYRGAFDGERIASALSASGYREETTAVGIVRTIGPDAEVDLTAPIQRQVVSAYNNIAIIGDELIVASPFLTRVEATLAVLAGDASSLGADQTVAELVDATGEELVSAGLFDGSLLSYAEIIEQLPGRAPDEGVASPVAGETIAPASLVLFGITAGSMGPFTLGDRRPVRGDHDETVPRSEWIVAVQLPTAEDAARAVPIVNRRLTEGRSLATRQPYAEYFEGWEVEAVEDEPIVRLRISGDQVGRLWVQFIEQRDLAFIVTE